MPSLLAPAKLNLALHVTGIRTDGYHELSTLVAFAGIGDVLRVEAFDTLALEVSGPFAEAITDDARDNLVWKVAERLREVGGVTQGAHIHLEKHLPVASGIGGGSSDAATAAILLNDLWNLGYSDDALAALLLPLGADIPMCIYRKPALVGGIGERISSIDSILAMSLVLVNPGIVVSTPEIFRAYDRQGIRESSGIYPFEGEWTVSRLKVLRNDLQPIAVETTPVIAEVLAALEESSGCLLARMSGSGATCFGIYPSDSAASEAAQIISRRCPQWWVRACSAC